MKLNLKKKTINHMRFSNKTCMYYIRLNTGENYPKTKVCHRTEI